MLDTGTETCSIGIFDGLSEPCCVPSVVRMDILEGPVFLQVQQYASAPLVQNDTPTEASAFVLQQTFTVVFNESHRFTGKPYSQATGLYYSFQRWYDPEIGRFISPDPVLGSLSYPQTQNRYVYVVNNPRGVLQAGTRGAEFEVIVGAYKTGYTATYLGSRLFVPTYYVV